MPSGNVPKNNVRPCTMTNASISGQDMHPSSALYMGRNVETVAKKTIPRWFADPHRDNWETSRPRRWLMRCTRRVRIVCQNEMSMTEIFIW